MPWSGLISEIRLNVKEKKSFLDLDTPLIFRDQIRFLTNAIEENSIDSHLVIQACLLP